MLWLFLLLVLLAASCTWAAKKRRTNQLIVITLCLLITCVTYLASQLYYVTFFNRSTWWGTAVILQRLDASAIELVENLNIVEATQTTLAAQIQALKTETKALTEQHRYLIGKFYLALIQLDYTSQLNSVLLQRLTPLATLWSDHPVSAEALRRIAAMKATIRQATHNELLTPIEEITFLAVLEELRENFTKIQEHRNKVIANMYAQAGNLRQVEYDEYEIEPEQPFAEEEEVPFDEEIPFEEKPLEPPINPEPELEPEPINPAPPPYEEIKPIPPPIYQPFESLPNQSNDAPPQIYRPFGLSISDADLYAFALPSRLAGDIVTVQQHLINTTLQTLTKLEQELQLRYIEKQAEGTAYYRAASSNVPIAFIFMPQEAKVLPGDPIYQCRLGLLWCNRIGIVKTKYPEPRRTQHPLKNEQLDGFLVEIEINDRSSVRSKILYVFHPWNPLKR